MLDVRTAQVHDLRLLDFELCFVSKCSIFPRLDKIEIKLSLVVLWKDPLDILIAGFIKIIRTVLVITIGKIFIVLKLASAKFAVPSVYLFYNFFTFGFVVFETFCLKVQVLFLSLKQTTKNYGNDLSLQFLFFF